MVFGPLMDKVDVVLQCVDITAVIERHEQHNVIGIVLNQVGGSEILSHSLFSAVSIDFWLC